MFFDFRIPSGRTPVRVDDTYGCLSRPTCVDFMSKEVPRTFPRTSVGFMGASFLRLGHAALTMAEDAIQISKRGQELLPSDPQTSLVVAALLDPEPRATTRERIVLGVDVRGRRALHAKECAQQVPAVLLGERRCPAARETHCT
eukprot:scaffold662_cov364-Pavlova_lutheri.AAC.32